MSLIDILQKNNINYITNLKIDIEGYEDRALKPFFDKASKKLYPKNGKQYKNGYQAIN